MGQGLTNSAWSPQSWVQRLRAKAKSCSLLQTALSTIHNESGNCAQIQWLLLGGTQRIRGQNCEHHHQSISSFAH